MGVAAAPLLAMPGILNAQPAGKYIGGVQQNGQNYAVIVDIRGEVILKEPLPSRGHGAAIDVKHGQCVIFARRPDQFALVIDMNTNRPMQMFNCPANRHFYGHGFFSPDGEYLYATENDFDAERGVIGVYAAREGFARVAELDCFGIGCHEAILMSDGLTIAVANGGIATHPNYPRQKLNLPTMKSSLAYINRITGNLISQVFLPQDLYQLSVRHLVEGPNKVIFFGGQLQVTDGEFSQLIGHHTQGGGIEFVWLPEDLNHQLKQYTGSITANHDKSVIAVSCPRGDRLLMVDANSGELIETHELNDVCGVAENGTGFMVSNGDGALISNLGPDVRQFNWSWDNHLSFMPSPVL
ncbi:MAG: DUF1513 domain-containing protein [Sneathiella sp.]|nr:DUF1513 domain-containing protein [Sneathiella sp.]